MLAWNATCEWTPEGFASKSHELLRGRFEISSSFRDRDHLRHDAADVIIEEWPIKRVFAPFANKVADIARYLMEVEASRTE